MTDPRADAVHLGSHWRPRARGEARRVVRVIERTYKPAFLDLIPFFTIALVGGDVSEDGPFVTAGIAEGAFLDKYEPAGGPVVLGGRYFDRDRAVYLHESLTWHYVRHLPAPTSAALAAAHAATQSAFGCPGIVTGDFYAGVNNDSAAERTSWAVMHAAHPDQPIAFGFSYDGPRAVAEVIRVLNLYAGEEQPSVRPIGPPFRMPDGHAGIRLRVNDDDHVPTFESPVGIISVVVGDPAATLTGIADQWSGWQVSTHRGRFVTVTGERTNQARRADIDLAATRKQDYDEAARRWHHWRKITAGLPRFRQWDEFDDDDAFHTQPAVAVTRDSGYADWPYMPLTVCEKYSRPLGDVACEAWDAAAVGYSLAYPLSALTPLPCETRIGDAVRYLLRDGEPDSPETRTFFAEANQVMNRVHPDELVTAIEWFPKAEE